MGVESYENGSQNEKPIEILSVVIGNFFNRESNNDTAYKAKFNTSDGVRYGLLSHIGSEFSVRDNGSWEKQEKGYRLLKNDSPKSNNQWLMEPSWHYLHHQPGANLEDPDNDTPEENEWDGDWVFAKDGEPLFDSLSKKDSGIELSDGSRW